MTPAATAPDEVRRDLRAIRDRLGCDAVLIMATSRDRLLAAGRIAREEGLDVWLQPRVFDVGRNVVADDLALVAEQAEALRQELGGVSLNVGCELSLSARGSSRAVRSSAAAGPSPSSGRSCR